MVGVREGVTSTMERLEEMSCGAPSAMTPHVKPVPALTDCQACGVTWYVRASVTVPVALFETCTDVKT
jgi:hypothetical protein